jgi:uncharacterized membrane protein
VSQLTRHVFGYCVVYNRFPMTSNSPNSLIWQRLLSLMAQKGRHYERAAALPWLIPLIYAFGALLVGFTVPRLTYTLLPGYLSTISVNSAIGIYSATASGMLALTGIVFSLTFLMVQFSASAYSPRLVLWISHDPVIPHATGVFTSTFVYALTSLAWVDRFGSGRVPLIGVVVLAALLIVSIIMFIGLIQRVSALQVTRILIFTGNQGREIIENLYPPLDTPISMGSLESLDSPCTQTLFHHGPPGKVQTIDIPFLVEMASRSGSVIEMTAAVGDAVLDSTAMLRVYGCSSQLPEEGLRNAIRLGDERTFEQDPRYALRLLVDIAIKALSPAINDPTTAVQALDEIEDLLIRLGRRRLEIGDFRDAHGKLRLSVIFPTWEDILVLALDEIRLYGATSVQVMRRMNALLSELLAILPEERRPALDYWQERLQLTIQSTFRDREDVLDASHEDRQGLGSSRRSRRIN